MAALLMAAAILLCKIYANDSDPFERESESGNL
jgi:hypothetical protein